MNQGRIWCVVNPTVGLPLFLGSVALTSLAVHTAVMSHTNWMSSYWQGAARVRVSELTAPAPARGAFSMTGPPVPATNMAQASFVITVTPAAGAPATRVASSDAPARLGNTVSVIAARSN